MFGQRVPLVAACSNSQTAYNPKEIARAMGVAEGGPDWVPGAIGKANTGSIDLGSSQTIVLPLAKHSIKR